MRTVGKVFKAEKAEIKEVIKPIETIVEDNAKEVTAAENKPKTRKKRGK